MKKKIKISNILLLGVVIYVFIVTAIEILNVKNEVDNIGITKHTLNYIGCVSVEDNVELTLLQGDSNYVEVTPEIEMFYSSGCLSLYGRGSAFLTVEKNTIQELYGKNNAAIKGEPGDSLQFLQASDNSTIILQLKNTVKNLELNLLDNSTVKVFGKKINKIEATAKDYSLLKIIATVDTAETKEIKKGKIFIKQVKFRKER
jgi:hypothetical protein